MSGQHTRKPTIFSYAVIGGLEGQISNKPQRLMALVKPPHSYKIVRNY